MASTNARNPADRFDLAELADELDAEADRLEVEEAGALPTGKIA